jgi:4-carboxymuconolactone decarboxylase
LNGSSLPSREREIVMLRMGWLCQSEYEWAQHARIGKADAGLTNADIRRIAQGPSAQGWSAFDRSLLQMADELRYEAMISDATWQALRSKYSPQQIMEALYTAAQYQLVSMVLNSLGIQLDPGLADRLPTDLPKPALAGVPESPRPARPRIAPLPQNEWSEEQRRLIEPELANGPVLNLFATMLQHPKLYGPRRQFGSYLQRGSLLDARTRELLIMRTAALLRSEYVWGHHVRYAHEAGLSDQEIVGIQQGPVTQWSEKEQALLRAADELRREAFVTNETWATLSRHYDTQRLIEIIYTVGGYTMTALATNSFGIQLEPGTPAFPDRRQ